MVNYFNYFPKTIYKLNHEQSVDVAVNLTTNYSIFTDALDNSSLYYEYTIPEEETPESLAYKLYGDAGYHWVIMRMNNIGDIKNDWPIDYKTLSLSIEDKYSTPQYADTANTEVTGLEWSMSNYKSYYKVETQQITGSGISLDPVAEIIEIDSDTYDSLATSTITTNLDGSNLLTITITKDRQTYYEYEMRLNESKRNIKILKSEFIGTIKEEFDRIMKQ